MDKITFANFIPAIRNFNGDPTDASLRLASEGPLSVYYAPFDWINPQARVVLVGITPGRTQAVNALAEAQRQLTAGASAEAALIQAKRTGAFSGSMRKNLVDMLDDIGLAEWLCIETCDHLFGAAAHLLQSASVLPYPVFVNGENYNGKPDIVGTPVLRRMLLEHFVPVANALRQAAFFPLGPVPAKALDWLVHQGKVDPRQVLFGLPHPSGANAERIQYFLRQKDATKLSAKTDPAKLDAARTSLKAALAAFAPA